MEQAIVRSRARWRTRLTALAIVAAVAAVILVPAETAHAAAPPPDWWSYDRAPTFVPVQSSISVPTRDGTPLQCDLNLPGDASGAVVPGRYPSLVLEFTPYIAARALYNIEAQYFTSRGYAAIVCNVRGTGGSGGTWGGVNTAVEARDNYDLVEWMAAQPWSNGRVGQAGESYGGMTGYRVAALQPPHLVTIAPQQSHSSLYTDVIFPGGIYATAGGTLNNWPDVAFRLSGGAIDPATQYALDASHPRLDDYWKQIAINTKYDKIKVPVLAFGGLDDPLFRAGMVENYLGLQDQTWAVFGPWVHASPINWPSCRFSATFCNTVETVPPGAVLAWFDRWLAQMPEAPLPSARLTAYEGPVGVGAGWRETDCWSPLSSEYTTLALQGNRDLVPPPGKKGSVSFSQPRQPSEPGGSLTFSTAALRSDQVIGGYGKLDLVATLSASDANFHVELLDIAPDGSTTVVNDGYLKASHARSHERPAPVMPGRLTTFPITIRPDLWRFVAGHKIGVRISGGAAETLTPVSDPVTVTVATGKDGSTLKLPVVPG
jgi:predicted acyl esterase